MPLLRIYSARTNGSMSIEAALVIPILMLSGLGAVDASNYLLQNHKMESGLVSAGRYLAKSDNPQSIGIRAKRLAVSGRTDSGVNPVLENWTTNDVTITYLSTNNSQGLYRGGDQILTVKISSELPYQGFGLLNAVTGGSTLRASYEERIVRSGS